MGEVGAAPGPYYRPADVARLLRCSEWWVKEQARRRRVPFCWIGGSYLFTDEHVAAILRLFEVAPNDPPPTTGVARTIRPATTPGDDTSSRLRARPPRRLRGKDSGKTAA
jgi:hypothetical protein